MSGLILAGGCRAPGIAVLLFMSAFFLAPGPPAWAAAGCPKCGQSPCACGGGGGARPGHTGSTRGPGGGMGGGFGLSVDLSGLFQHKPKAHAPDPIEIKDNQGDEKKPKKAQGVDCAELLKKVQAAEKKHLDAKDAEAKATREWTDAWKALERAGKTHHTTDGGNVSEGKVASDKVTDLERALSAADGFGKKAQSDPQNAETHKADAKKEMDKAKKCEEDLDKLVKDNKELGPLITAQKRASARLARAQREERETREAFEKLRDDYNKHCKPKYKSQT